VRHTPQRSPGFSLIGDENVVFGMAKGHGAPLSAEGGSTQGMTRVLAGLTHEMGN
jgi:hypothetical protein